MSGSPIVLHFTTPTALIRACQDAMAEGHIGKALVQSQLVAVAQAHPAIDFSQSQVNLTSDMLGNTHFPGHEDDQPEAFEPWLTQAWTMPAPPRSDTGASTNTSGRTFGKSSRSGASQGSRKASSG